MTQKLTIHLNLTLMLEFIKDMKI